MAIGRIASAAEHVGCMARLAHWHNVTDVSLALLAQW